MLLNRLIVVFLEITRQIILKLTPSKVQNRVEKSHQDIKEKRKKISSHVQTGLLKSFDWLKSLRKKGRIVFVFIQEKVAIIIHKVSSINFKKIKLTEIFLLIAAFFAPLFYKLKIWVGSFRPETIALSLSTTMLTGLFALALINSGTKIVKQGTSEEEIARELASKVEGATKISSRPDYYKLDERSHTLLNMQVPINLGGSTSLRSMLIDFTFVSSNQYTKNFLFQNEYLVQDRLNSMIDPIDAEFILEDEGKNVLKEKIKYELNLLIKDLKIEGRVEEVHIHSILAG